MDSLVSTDWLARHLGEPDLVPRTSGNVVKRSRMHPFAPVEQARGYREMFDRLEKALTKQGSGAQVRYRATTTL